LKQYGGVEQLNTATVDVSAPQADEVRVRVHAVAINPIDGYRRMGRLRMTEKSVLPRGTLHDVSGVVESTGSAVTAFKAGDRVFTRRSECGTLAEYVNIKAAECVVIPEAVGFEAAAAIPLAGLTALQSLRAAGLVKGETVFISGGAGGVGTFAIQLAKHWYGASRVVVTCSGKKAELCRSLGADECVDYTTRPKGKVFEGLGKFDVVFDTTGEATEMTPLVASGRTVVSVAKVDAGIAPDAGFAVRALLNYMSRDARRAAKKHGVKFQFYRLRHSVDDIALLGKLVAEGKVRAVIDSTFVGIEEHKRAFERAEKGRPAGKVVIVVRS